MGFLKDGVWFADEAAARAKGSDGRFLRPDSSFRNWVTPDGAPGPSGTGGFKAEPGRYHLYVSLACPWAHRALIFRALKGLEEMIPVSVTHWHLGENGWTFAEAPGVVADPINGAHYLHQIYTAADPNYSGRCTVPVLWDRQTSTIVSNESSEIIRMFNSAFDGVGAKSGDYYPAPLRAEIDGFNERIYDTLNNGVYKCGFARSQEAYDAAVGPLFETMDWLEEGLSKRRYLLGDATTEADWRLFPTLFRFDTVYSIHFKCTRRRVVDYPALWGYARDLFQHPGISGTVNLDHVRKHYYGSQESVNPSGIVPVLPAFIDFEAPHQRSSLIAA